jgi:hypothetical protein
VIYRRYAPLHGPYLPRCFSYTKRNKRNVKLEGTEEWKHFVENYARLAENTSIIIFLSIKVLVFVPCLNTKYCHVLGMHVTYRRILDWMIWFIDTLHSSLRTTIDYSVITISTHYISLLHTLASAVYHSLHYPFLATDIKTGSIIFSL